MAHTPGPWKVVREDVGDRYEVIVDVLVGSNGGQVMHLSGGYGHPKPADANLIALAWALPGLLEAAEAVLADADQSEDEPEVSLVATADLEVLRAAVAKAKEQPS